MTIHRLNHAVLYVRDVERSVDFYRSVLGFDVVMTIGASAAFLRADGSHNDHDLGLFEIGSGAKASDAGRSTVGLYHLAWEVETLRDIETLNERLSEADALVGTVDHSTTKSLYGRDPDGLEFEIAWVVPAARLDDDTLMRARGAGYPLDIAREVEKYGAHTPGGYGVSRVAAADVTS